MAVRRDRIGEEGYNSFGSKMVIKEYNISPLFFI